jgi:Lrp/AsnC family leucine-responsive transcriptional regulator
MTLDLDKKLLLLLQTDSKKDYKRIVFEIKSVDLQRCMSALKIKREGIIDKYVVLLNKEG